MKRFLKKNQIIITTLAIMIAVAGYLNYSGKLFEEPQLAEETTADLANQELLDISEEDLEANTGDIESNDSEVEGTPGEAVLTNSTVEATIAQAKISREQIRSQNREVLQGIIDSDNLSDEQKQDAVNQLVQMTDLTEQEMAVETLLASKGFAECVVNLTESSADIVVAGSELTDANLAQIEDIVTRKTEIAPENIVITTIEP